MQFFRQFPHLIAVMSEKTDGPMGNSTNHGPKGEYGYNRMHFLERNGIDPDRLVMAGLVHGAAVRLVLAIPPEKRVPDTDGLVSKSLAIAITTSDCLPVFFYSPVMNWVGLAHAGWRSILGGIIPMMIEKFKNLGADAAGVRAAIGPGIHYCCYRVRDDENGAPRYRGYERFVSPDGRGRFQVDLKGIAFSQLNSLGVPVERVEASSECTSCNNRFFSWRRDRLPGHNMLSVIQLKFGFGYETFVL